MRVSIDKKTGRIIEMQSHATEGTLIRNACNAGYRADQVDERELTEDEYIKLRAAQPRTAEETLEDVRAARRAAYPSVGDALEAIAAGGKAFEEWQGLCRKVKERYPKP